MEIKSDNPEHGFQFPGTFELSAMGSADKDLQAELPRLLMDAGHRRGAANRSAGSIRPTASTCRCASLPRRLAARSTTPRTRPCARIPEVKWTL